MVARVGVEIRALFGTLNSSPGLRKISKIHTRGFCGQGGVRLIYFGPQDAKTVCAFPGGSCSCEISEERECSLELQSKLDKLAPEVANFENLPPISAHSGLALPEAELTRETDVARVV